jgi:hypothetical protein
MKKICIGCGRNRRIGKFAMDSNRPDGKRIYCRDCISIINKKYRTSPIGRIKHKKSVDNWKKNNKLAIRKYNKEYYRKKKHIILYNKRAKADTIPMLPVEQCQHRPIVAPDRHNRVHITINPRRRLESNLF